MLLSELVAWACTDCSKFKKLLLRQQLFAGIGAEIDRACRQTAEQSPHLHTEWGDASLDMSVEQYNALYWQECCTTVGREPLQLSCAPDKSRVHRMGLLNCPFVTPGNALAWGPPQDLSV